MHLHQIAPNLRPATDGLPVPRGIVLTAHQAILALHGLLEERRRQTPHTHANTCREILNRRLEIAQLPHLPSAWPRTTPADVVSAWQELEEHLFAAAGSGARALAAQANSATPIRGQADALRGYRSDLRAIHHAVLPAAVLADDAIPPLRTLHAALQPAYDRLPPVEIRALVRHLHRRLHQDLAQRAHLHASFLWSAPRHHAVRDLLTAHATGQPTLRPPATARLQRPVFAATRDFPYQPQYDSGATESFVDAVHAHLTNTRAVIPVVPGHGKTRHEPHPSQALASHLLLTAATAGRDPLAALLARSIYATTDPDTGAVTAIARTDGEPLLRAPRSPDTLAHAIERDRRQPSPTLHRRLEQSQILPTARELRSGLDAGTLTLIAPEDLPTAADPALVLSAVPDASSPLLGPTGDPDRTRRAHPAAIVLTAAAGLGAAGPNPVALHGNQPRYNSLFGHAAAIDSDDDLPPSVDTATHASLIWLGLAGADITVRQGLHPPTPLDRGLQLPDDRPAGTAASLALIHHWHHTRTARPAPGQAIDGVSPTARFHPLAPVADPAPAGHTILVAGSLAPGNLNEALPVLRDMARQARDAIPGGGLTEIHWLAPRTTLFSDTDVQEAFANHSEPGIIVALQPSDRLDERYRAADLVCLTKFNPAEDWPVADLLVTASASDPGSSPTPVRSIDTWGPLKHAGTTILFATQAATDRLATLGVTLKAESIPADTSLRHLRAALQATPAFATDPAMAARLITIDRPPLPAGPQPAKALAALLRARARQDTQLLQARDLPDVRDVRTAPRHGQEPEAPRIELATVQPDNPALPAQALRRAAAPSLAGPQP